MLPIRRIPLLAVAAALALALAACGGSSPNAASASGSSSLIPVRIAAIVSSGQGEFSTAMTAAGIDKRFGLKVTVVPISTTGGQFLSLRGGAADVASGSVLDLLRQRKQGLAVQAFGAFQRFVNPIITTASSPVKTFAHLAGKQVGTPSTTLLDWLITRAAGKKAYGVDLGTQATPVPASTILLNQLLTKGQLSGALQFASLASTPVAQGKFRELTTVPDLVKAAGFNTNSFYTLFIVSDSWVKAHPGGLNRLQEAMAATYQLLMTQTSPWTALAGQVGITQPAQITAYMNAQRASFATTYGKQLLQPTTDLLNSLISITGAATVGVSHVDPNAFVFPTSSGSAPW